MFNSSFAGILERGSGKYYLLLIVGRKGQRKPGRGNADAWGVWNMSPKGQALPKTNVDGR